MLPLSFFIQVKKKACIGISIIILGLLITGCSDHKITVLSKQYKYDNKGRLISKITPDGSKIKFKYNSKDLLIEIEYPDDPVKYDYDTSGNRIWMQNINGRTEYKYDAFDRLKEVTFRYSPEKKIRYEYDPWNRISAIMIMDQANIVEYQVKYEYNIIGNLTSIDDGIGCIEYKYHPDKGEAVRHLPNGIKTTFSFSPLGELTTLKHLDRHSRLIASYRYKYNPADKISCVIEQTPDGLKTTKYDWDSRGYLNALHLPDGKTIRYEYDSMGNRILEEGIHGTVCYKYDNLGRLITAGNIRYKWDKNGNLFSFAQDGQKTRFMYNERNLLSLVRLPRATIRYGWDGDGNMISKSIGKGITHYLPNPLAPPGFTLAEYDNMGKMQSTYLYGDTLLGQRDRNGRMQYFLEDGFNSIRHITGIKGNILSQRDYSPFGEPALIKGDISLNFRMAGERFLPETKSYLIGGRLYEPKIGSYLTPDPLPNSPLRFDSFNQYAHSRGAPTSFMEPKCNQTIKGPSMFPKFEPLHTPIGYRPQDYNDPVFKRARELNELGQRLPLPPQHIIKQHDQYWSEGRYWDTDPYYQGLKNLDQVAPLTPENYLKAWGLALGTVGSNLAKGLLGGWGGAVKEGGDLFIPFTSQGKKAWDTAGTFIDLLNPLKFLGGKLLEGAGQYFREKYENFTGCPIGGALSDPFNSIENKLGGIKLSSSAEFIGNLSNIAGAVYDPQRQCLVLVGDEDVALPSIKAGDLAVALACAFNPRYGDPQFSLDPYNPKNPRGKWLKAVYMPNEVIRGTPFGKTLFEADWLLKQYGFGVSIDKEGKKKERKSSVPGFKNTVDLTFERPGGKQGQESWARFWIVSDEMKLREHGNSIYFDVAKMRVKAKSQVPDPSSPTGLRDVESNDPIASAFADQFSRLYDEISKESPEFGRVKELAKTVALAKWLKKENIPIDMDWVTKYVNKRIQTVDRIPALSERWERRTETPFTRGNRSGIRTIIRQLHLFGGVDLTVKPKFVSGGRIAQNLQKEVAAALREKETGPVFGITLEGKALRAVVLPITKNGQEMWKTSPTIDKDGTTYQFNDEGIITTSTDRFGNSSEYSYDTGQRLKAIKVRAKNGWEAFAEKDVQGSLWTVTNQRGNVFRYRYGGFGYLSEIELDGKKIASYNYNPKSRIVDINYQGYKEKVSYDNNGYIQDYEVQRVSKDAQSVPEVEKISFDYDDSGNITQIKGSSVENIAIDYSREKLPISIRTPRERISYIYGPQKRVRKISYASGPSVTYSYDGEKLAKAIFEEGSLHAEYVFREGRLVKTQDFFGGTVEYGYTIAGLLDSVVDPRGNEGRYVYDDEGRLREIRFPDGRWIEYSYEGRKTRDKKGNSSQGRSVSVISHSSSSPLRKTRRQESRPVQHAEDVLQKRLDDDLRASRRLRSGIVLDLFAESKSIAHSNIVDSRGNVVEINPDAAKELRWLLNTTARIRGKLGKTILKRWDKFYIAHLDQLAEPQYLNLPDGKKIKLKPLLIIKSNEVNYKYANLEKVPVLKDNFIIFIASKPKESEEVAETSAEELATKINNIPKLSKDNAVFAIRLPKMKKEMQREWRKTISDLEKVVGKDNVLFNPSKESFDRMLHDRKKEIIVIELTHTDKGITLRGNERYSARDVFRGGDLSHIKYLMAGNTCSLPRLEKGDLAAVLRKKGVGIMNTSYSEVSTETALKRLRELIRILENIDAYQFPAYYLPDVIDQSTGLSEKKEGTTNLGKLDLPDRRFLG